MAPEGEREKQLRSDYKKKLEKIISAPGDLTAEQVWDLVKGLEAAVVFFGDSESNLREMVRIIISHSAVASVFASKCREAPQILPEAIRKSLSIDEVAKEAMEVL